MLANFKHERSRSPVMSPTVPVIPKYTKAPNIKYTPGRKSTLQQAFRILHKLWEPCKLSEVPRSQASCLDLTP